jgi:hypothetical protein
MGLIRSPESFQYFVWKNNVLKIATELMLEDTMPVSIQAPPI